ncbi:MAG: MFS transporter [Myxococcales bacterium]|nr:MFS transporter [Myxococcota bacterium]MDW8282597.1 MFS transporter [Myxococcales bacterium]
MTAATWRFPAAFWIANLIELLERAAYYGTFIALSLYLTSVVGFTDVGAGYVAGLFAAGLYLLPFFSGAAADRMGFRRALLLAFALLGLGYAGLGVLPRKGPVVVSLLLIMLGGAFVKPVITGTVARSSNERSRARAYSLFYMMVNIGSFLGKALARPVRVRLGLDYIPLYSSAAALLALVLVLLCYFPREVAVAEQRKSVRAVVGDIQTVLRDRRFLSLILLTAAFWAIQGQLYASMPKYVLRLVGEHASPEWYANINPLTVVVLVVPITHLARRFAPIASIAVSLALIPLSALTVAVLPGMLGGPVRLAGITLHQVAFAMMVGIALQGLAECFLSPRYYEFASQKAPPGQEGLYLGYAQLNSFFAWLLGFILSGYLLDAFCPDPRTLSEAERAAHALALAGRGPMPAAYAHASYIWLTFAAMGAVAFVLLLLFQASSRPRGRDGTPIDPKGA